MGVNHYGAASQSSPELLLRPGLTSSHFSATEMKRGADKLEWYRSRLGGVADYLEKNGSPYGGVADKLE